jgi:hypothetical protein
MCDLFVSSCDSIRQVPKVCAVLASHLVSPHIALSWSFFIAAVILRFFKSDVTRKIKYIRQRGEGTARYVESQ